MDPMKEQAKPVNAITELPTETREFLARLRRKISIRWKTG